jgi:hypothetical protein
MKKQTASVRQTELLEKKQRHMWLQRIVTLRLNCSAATAHLNTDLAMAHAQSSQQVVPPRHSGTPTQKN